MEDEFPDDDNGEALRNMARSGDDLSKERDIDFSVIFTRELESVEFCRAISKHSWRVHRKDPGVYSNVWDVTVTMRMVPTYEAISRMEEQLESLAAPFGGQVDGWGCFAV